MWFFSIAQLPDHLTTHPPVPHTCVSHICVTGAVRTAPVTVLPFAAAHEGSYGWVARGTLPLTTEVRWTALRVLLHHGGLGSTRARLTWLLKATYRSATANDHRANERQDASDVQTPFQCNQRPAAELNLSAFPHLGCGTGFRQPFNNNSTFCHARHLLERYKHEQNGLRIRSTATALAPL